jgi:hypothetical protein
VSESAHNTSELLCTWPALAKGSKCPACGYALKRDYDRTPHRLCGDQTPRPVEPPGLGDAFASFLDSIGITEDRWLAVAGKYKLPSCGGCKKRKAALNKIGHELGVDALAAKLTAWFKR